MSKKQEIFNAAIQLFADKGFNQTSVEEIAKNTGISKGGFYTYFSSKNELMLEMIKEYHNRMTDKVTAFEHLSPRQNNIAPFIELELEVWIEYQTFFTVLFKEFHPQKDKKIAKELERLRQTLENNHRAILYRVYGNKFTAYFKDMIILLEGMMKEYLIYLAEDLQNVDVKKLSEWIASHMDAIVRNIKKQPPFLKEESTGSIPELIKESKQIIRERPLPDQEKLNDALEKLKHLYHEQTAFTIIIEALIHYLRREPAIRIRMLKIERLWKKQEEQVQ